MDDSASCPIHPRRHHLHLHLVHPWYANKPPAAFFILSKLIESPRWLVSKNRRDEALRSLNRLRPQRDIDNGFTGAEIDNLELAFQEASGHNQGRWLDLFRGNMLWRTWIAWSLFVFLQFTGVQFVNRCVIS